MKTKTCIILAATALILAAPTAGWAQADNSMQMQAPAVQSGQDAGAPAQQAAQTPDQKGTDTSAKKDGKDATHPADQQPAGQQPADQQPTDAK